MRRSPPSQTSSQSNLDCMRPTALVKGPTLSNRISSSNMRTSASPESRPGSTLMSNNQRGNFKQKNEYSASPQDSRLVGSKSSETEPPTSKQSGNKMSVSNLISEPEPVLLPPMHGFYTQKPKPKGALPAFIDNTIETNKGPLFFPLNREHEFRGSRMSSVPNNGALHSEAGPSLLKFLSENHKATVNTYNQSSPLPGLSSRYLDIGGKGKKLPDYSRPTVGNSSQRRFPTDLTGKSEFRPEVNKDEIDYDNLQVSSLKSQYQPVANEPKAKRPWTEQEDALLRSLVEQLGQGLWAAIAAQIPGRSGKQVRERWLNHLSPNVTKRPWSLEEDEIIIESHRRFGNCWSRIAKLLEGRSDNSVKNRFYTTLRRRITTPRPVNKRGSPPFAQSALPTKKKRKSPSVQQPSEQVEIVNRRYKQARVWE